MNNEELFEQDGMDEVMEDVIEMTDEEGNTILFSIIDYFFYNGEEYAILTDSNDEDGVAKAMEHFCIHPLDSEPPYADPEEQQRNASPLAKLKTLLSGEKN